MAKKEVKTDYWVNKLLDDVDLNLTPQGCDVKELDDALKTASKRGTKKVGFPEFCGVVGDFVIVIEDKSSVDKHIKYDERNLISLAQKDIQDYAVNGAFFYALHLIKNSNFKKIFAIGVSGDSKKHRITPVFINEREDWQELDDVETFLSFNEKNILEYYTRTVLGEATDFEKTTEEILKDARSLHEDLRNYGSIQDKDKPLVVSGIMLALREIDHKTFSIKSLNGDKVKTDGQKIYDAIKSNLDRANVTPETKKDKLLSQFSVIKNTTKINVVDDKLGNIPICICYL